ncbi:hypothetical protein RJ640_001086 [Escallonia rubra]|uniref:Uncharacterized protein n=1 Tax=Escallonia rubra TaxID=112253 RepID=A0AA88QTR4_9ASTE|nr:hypothetical protein RJ640_001086 [Escallonia rubra]
MSNRKSSDIAYCFEHVERFGEMGFLYAIALLASGQSSTMTGTFAGQFIMQVLKLFALDLSFNLYISHCGLSKKLIVVLGQDTVVTFIEPLKLEPVVQMRMEGGHGNTDEVFEQNHVPFREDLSNIPFPE